MRDGVFSGDEGPAVVAKVPGVGDVWAAEVLARVVDVDVEGDGTVLDKTLVSLVQVIDLGKGNSERNLVWRERNIQYSLLQYHNLHLIQAD